MYVCAQNGREEIRVLGGLGASGGGDGAGADKGGVVDQARALVREVIRPTEVLRAFPRPRTRHGQWGSLGSPTSHPRTRIPPREAQGTNNVISIRLYDISIYVFWCVYICSIGLSLYVS